jgi:hypothetical protein
MPCLADRQFCGHALWQEAATTGADPLWRVKRKARLPRAAVLADGSCLTTVCPSAKDRRHRTKGVRVRAIEYRLEGVADAEPLYRLVTTSLAPPEPGSPRAWIPPGLAPPERPPPTWPPSIASDGRSSDGRSKGHWPS